MSYEYRPLSQETLARIIRTRSITINGLTEIELHPETRWVVIRNVSSNPIYLGNETVSEADGFVLKTDEIISLNVLPGFKVYVFASSAEIRVMEAE